MARISEIHYSTTHEEESGYAIFVEIALSPHDDPADFVLSMLNFDGVERAEISLDSDFLSSDGTSPIVSVTYDPHTGEMVYVVTMFKTTLTEGEDTISYDEAEAVSLVDVSGGTNTVIDFYDWGEGSQNIVATDGAAAGATSEHLDAASSGSIQFNQPSPDTPVHEDATPGDTGFVCFVAGTLIDTPDGPVPVETLCAGDLVITQEAGPQPLIWTGARTVVGEGDYAPYRISEGTLDSTAPVYISPAHRVLYTGAQAQLLFGEEEVLVPIKMLANDKSILRDPRPEVTYCHIMFEEHQIVYSHGLASESFFPGAVAMSTLEEETRSEILDLFPELRDDPRVYGSTCHAVVKAHEAHLLTV